MEEFEEQDGIAFILLSFTARDERYYVPFEDILFYWKRMEEGGRKSFTYAELDKSWKVISHHDIFVHYLPMLQRDLERRDG